MLQQELQIEIINLTEITEVNNTKIDNGKDLGVVILMYNLIEYSDNYSKASASLYLFYRDEPNDNDITESKSFKLKSKFLDNTNNEGIINTKIVVSLKYLSNFWRTLEIPLFNGETNLILIWSANRAISEGDRATTDTTFAITDTKLYVPLVALSIQDNTKSL